MSRAVVMRYPVIMEDEGVHRLAKICESVEEAEKWIEAQQDEYFRPTDYYIVSE